MILCERPGFGNVWHAYECLDCGARFDVRTKPRFRSSDKLPCPICHCPCDFKASWEADEDGYKRRAKPADDVEEDE